jgi:hypothetical protein
MGHSFSCFLHHNLVFMLSEEQACARRRLALYLANVIKIIPSPAAENGAV